MENFGENGRIILKCVLKEIGCEDVHWIKSGNRWSKRFSPVNMVIKLWFHRSHRISSPTQLFSRLSTSQGHCSTERGQCVLSYGVRLFLQQAARAAVVNSAAASRVARLVATLRASGFQFQPLCRRRLWDPLGVLTNFCHSFYSAAKADGSPRSKSTLCDESSRTTGTILLLS